MKYIELFGGIGGFRHGIEKANNNSETSFKGIKEIRRYSSNIGKRNGWKSTLFNRRWECIGYYEIDKYAVKTYNKNFKEDYKPIDITKVPAESIPDHDILTGGFPCQSFSIAGKRKGFEDTRGTLFFDICRIIKAKRPSILFLENVKGLLSHDEGRTFGRILSALDELGYDVEWQVLNSKHFGVPQNRERVFIIGHIRGKSIRQILPLGESNKFDNDKGEELQKPISNTLRTNYSHAYSNETYVADVSPTIKTEVPTIMDSLHHHRTGEYGTGVKVEESFTLDSSSGNDLIINKIRRLTPIECERLQGFPDDWTKGVSDTQRYKQLGNAVTVNVIEAIARRLYQIS